MNKKSGIPKLIEELEAALALIESGRVDAGRRALAVVLERLRALRGGGGTPPGLLPPT